MYQNHFRPQDNTPSERSVREDQSAGTRLRLRPQVVITAAAVILLAIGFLCGFLVGRATNSGSRSPVSAAGTPSPAPTDAPDNVPADIALPSYIYEDLLPINPYSRCGDKLRRVNSIVIHYVENAGSTAAQNRDYFANLADTHETSASSNLIVGLDGEVLLCVPLDEVAYCSHPRNYDTISIEFCHPDRDGWPTQATYDSLVRLTAWLCDLYGLDGVKDVIRHFDVSGKECPRYYVQNQDEWAGFKRDVAAAQKSE